MAEVLPNKIPDDLFERCRMAVSLMPKIMGPYTGLPRSSQLSEERFPDCFGQLNDWFLSTFNTDTMETVVAFSSVKTIGDQANTDVHTDFGEKISISVSNNRKLRIGTLVIAGETAILRKREFDRVPGRKMFKQREDAKGLLVIDPELKDFQITQAPNKQAIIFNGETEFHAAPPIPIGTQRLTIIGIR